MNAVNILGGVLVLVYFGSILVGGRAVRGHGLPSGTEFLLFGFIIGPNVLALLSRSMLGTIEPLTEVFLAWVGLTVGGHYGFAGGERIARTRLAVGGLFALATLVATTLGAAAILYVFSSIRGRDLAIVSLGIGCVSAETTRYAVRWVTERYNASGPLSLLISELAEADDIIPVLGLAAVFALAPQPTNATFQWSAWTSIGLTLGLGGILGATASALADIEARAPQRWGILVGTSLLGVGVCAKLGLSSITVLFLMGVTLARLSRARSELHDMLNETERPVMLPCLIFAGAYVEVPGSKALVAAAVAALVLRAITKALLGTAVAGKMRGAENATRMVGLAMLSGGVLTTTLGLFCAIRFKGPIGETILFAGACGAIFGELIGPMMLRRELVKAGEVTVDSSILTPMILQRPKPTRVKISGPRVGRGAFAEAARRARSRRKIHGSP